MDVDREVAKRARQAGVEKGSKRRKPDDDISILFRAQAKDDRQEVRERRLNAQAIEDDKVTLGLLFKNSMFRTTNYTETNPTSNNNDTTKAWPLRCPSRNANGTLLEFPTGVRRTINQTTITGPPVIDEYTMDVLSFQQWLTGLQWPTISPMGYARSSARPAVGSIGRYTPTGNTGTSSGGCMGGYMDIKQINYEFAFRVLWDPVRPPIPSTNTEGQTVRFCVFEFENPDGPWSVGFSKDIEIVDIFAENFIGANATAQPAIPDAPAALTNSLFRFPLDEAPYTVGNYAVPTPTAVITTHCNQGAATSTLANDQQGNARFPHSVVVGGSPHNFRCIHDEKFHFEMRYQTRGNCILRGTKLAGEPVTLGATGFEQNGYAVGDNAYSSSTYPTIAVPPAVSIAGDIFTERQPQVVGTYVRKTSVKIPRRVNYKMLDPNEEASVTSASNIFADRFYMVCMFYDNPWYPVDLTGCCERQIGGGEAFIATMTDAENILFEDYDKDGKVAGVRAHEGTAK